MTPDADFSAHTLNMKLALRSLKKRCEDHEGQLGHEATIWDTGILADAPLAAGLVASNEYVIDLFEDVVFIIELGQFGIPREGSEEGVGYVPIPAKKLVNALTHGITSQDEAFSVLERFYKAIMNKP